MTGHDAFFSYSNADNAAHNQFVTDFRNMLKKLVAARLRLKFPKVKFVDEILDFFIDQEGLPANGPISDGLREHVAKSEFLFILVGKGYLDSEYCQREREWFRAAFHQNEQTALGRTFLIFMTGEALTMATEGDLGKLRSSVFWKSTGGDRPNRPMRPMLPTRNGELDENPKLVDVLNDLADTYVERYQHAIEQPAFGTKLTAEIRKHYSTTKEALAPVGLLGSGGPGASTGRRSVAIGAVTPNLKAYRDGLIEGLRSNDSFDLQVVELGDLVDRRDEIVKRLADARAFVQVFDDSAVRADRDDPPGGHLEVQRRLLSQKTRILWWMPPASARGAGRPEQDPTHLAVITSLAAEAGSGGQREAEDALLRMLDTANSRRAYAMVGVECNSIDRPDVEDACRAVKWVWQNAIGNGMKLEFATVPFDRLMRELESLDGIVVVDRSKQLRALLNQTVKIQEQLDYCNAEVAQQVFVLPPQEQPAAPLNWQIVVFRKGAEKLEVIREYDGELREFLERVRRHADNSPLAPAAD